jgi:ribonuclease HI
MIFTGFYPVSCERTPATKILTKILNDYTPLPESSLCSIESEVASRKNYHPKSMMKHERGNGILARTQALRKLRLRERRRTKRRLVTVPKNDRRFDSQKHGIKAVEDFSSGLRRLDTDPESVVIAVHGACNANGLLAARASYGVFFSNIAEDLNSNGIVPASSPQTSQYAELYATIQALESVHQLIIAGEDLSHVIIKTNSAYLEKGLSVFIWKWALNGFLNHDGKPVVNGRAFKYLHEKVVLLEKEYGIHVSFCLVEKKFNEPAGTLARAALQ